MKDKAYSVQAVANAFMFVAQQAGRRLTHMQLQKLVYISQGFALADLGRPMYFNQTEAWEYGPVIPDLYHDLKQWGRMQVRQPIEVGDAVADGSKEAEIIKAVFRAYGDKDGMALSGFTHRSETPWAIARREEKDIISNDLIRRKYSEWLKMADEMADEDDESRERTNRVGWVMSFLKRLTKR